MRFRFSIRLLFAATFVVACLAFLAIEFGGVTKSDGGGQQTVSLTSIPESVSEIECIAVRDIDQANSVVSALSSENRLNLYSHIEPAMVSSHVNFKANLDLEIQQSWSSTEVGRTKWRSHYGQRYRCVVLNLKGNAKKPMQIVVDLPEYCRPVQVSHFPEPQDAE